MIPARYGSSRFPGKMLAPLCGKPVILRTCEAAYGMDFFDEVYVVTDDDRIYDTVTSNGFKCIKSIREHETGSDRIAEAVSGIDCDIVVNIQGDEPFTSAETIRKVLAPFENDIRGEIDLCTLKERMTGNEEILNPNNVKVITDSSGYAIYFSRSPIPYPMNEGRAEYFRHIGIYAFRKSAIKEFASMPKGHLEAAERIECLRFIENGKRIMVTETSGMKVSIDTPEDLAMAEAIMSSMKK